MNRGASSRVYKNNEYNQLVGLCTGSSDPELWFSDTSDQLNGKGKVLKPEVKERMIARTLAAISICSICPIKEACLAEGMKPQNIDFGVWGGTLPGERLAMSTRSRTSRDVINKMKFASQVREAERLLLGEVLS